MQIEGSVALVTGGASGLGRASVEALLERGGRAVICDLPRSSGESVAAELGESVAFAPTDVTDADQVQTAVDMAVERFGGLHILVDCAGIGWAQRTVSRSGPHDLKVFDLVVRVNLIGTFNVIRLAAQQMSAQQPIGEERGSSSTRRAWRRSMGRSVRPRTRRPRAAWPGHVRYPMLAQLPDEQRQKLAAEIPHPQRLGRPAEFAGLVRHIVENPMLNGETIWLDGAIRMPPR